MTDDVERVMRACKSLDRICENKNREEAFQRILDENASLREAKDARQKVVNELLDYVLGCQKLQEDVMSQPNVCLFSYGKLATYNELLKEIKELKK